MFSNYPDNVVYIGFLLPSSCALAIIMGVKILSKKAEVKKNQIKYHNDVIEYKKAIQLFENEKAAYVSQVLICEQHNKDRYDSFLQQQADNDADFEKRNSAYYQLVEEADQLAITLKETTCLLENIYERNVIYPKYRNLIAMTEIHEYLDSGRFAELEGPLGAYNRYEDEVRLNRIITQIGQVIQNLENIKENQSLLYNRLSDVKTSLDYMTYDITRTLNEIKGLKANSVDLLNFSSISSYCTKEIAENTKSIHRLIAAGVYEQ